MRTMTTNTEKQNVAVGYVRVSTLGQVTGKKGKKAKNAKGFGVESLDIQKEVIKKYCTNNELELLFPFYENAGVSGAKADRPALMKLMEDAKAGRFRTVVVHSITRFGRSNVDMSNNVEQLKALGVSFQSIKERIDTSDDNPYAEFQRQILQACAELERRVIYERTSEGKQAKVEAGLIFPYEPPFGYEFKHDGKEGMLVQVPEEADIVREMVEMYLDRDMTYQQIAEALGSRGKRKHKKGDKDQKATWTSSSARYVLRNTVHYGLYFTEDGTREWTVEQPYLMTKERWDQIGYKAERNKVRKEESPESSEFWLKTLLRCGSCIQMGAKKARMSTQKGKPRYYYCYWAQKASESECKHYGRPKCNMPYLDAGKLENRVLDQLFRQLSINPETYLAKILDPDKLARDIQGLEEKKTALKKDLARETIAQQNTKLLLHQKDFDPNEYTKLYNETVKRISGLKIQIQGIEQAITKLGEDHEKAQNAYQTLLKLKGSEGSMEQIKKAIRELEPQKKAQLFRALCRDVITVTPSGGIATRINLETTIDLKAKVIYDLVGNRVDIEGMYCVSHHQ